MSYASTDELETAGCYALICLALFVGLAIVVKKTSGRSGPISGLTFVVCGPVLGVVLMTLELLRNGVTPKRYETSGSPKASATFPCWYTSPKWRRSDSAQV